VTADVRLDMIAEMIDVGKQCHDSCGTSALTRVRPVIANKKRQFKRAWGHYGVKMLDVCWIV